MTQKNDIVDFFLRSLNTEITLSTLYDTFPFPRPSIRRIMGTETKKELFERTKKGAYKLKNIYFKVAQTKTGFYKSVDKSDKGDVSIDATISGWIRIDKIKFKQSKRLKLSRIDPNVRDNLNKEFISHIYDILLDDDHFRGLGLSTIKFDIEGMELRVNDFDYAQSRYRNDWTVENLELQTDSGDYVVAENKTVMIKESDLY